ncbi:hypothetical protein GCM10023258_33600 [Terrabacter aeriphilus]|uniref:Acyl-CoA carboxylase epsilon subunit-like protein n=1 Tax=Terrabacter aeriphilus TaxID=515662 RepID=A0ABP9JKR0_9MICO
MSAQPTPEGAVPSIRVTGAATAEEVAALVTVLSALGGEPEGAPEHRTSAWSDPSWRLLGPARSGGWRASGLPR